MAAGGAAPVRGSESSGSAGSVEEVSESNSKAEREVRSHRRRSLSDDPVTRSEREGRTRRVLMKSVWATVVEMEVLLC